MMKEQEEIAFISELLATCTFERDLVCSPEGMHDPLF